MKKMFFIFLIFSFSIFAEWTIEKSKSNDNMSSLFLKDDETTSTGLVVVSTDFDGNLALVYLANLALEKLEEVKNFSDFSYGYSSSEKKFLAIKTVANGIITIENSNDTQLLKAITSFNKSDMNME